MPLATDDITTTDTAANDTSVANAATAETAAPAVTESGTPAAAAPGRRSLAVVRILLGMVFLWPFLDKLFGLGFGTPAERAWLNGASPTTGYLSGLEGPFAGLLKGLAGHAVVDVLFMFGMLAVGVALIIGAPLKLAALGAVCLMGPLYLASQPLGNHPFIDEHLMYIALAIGLAASRAGDTWGIGTKFAQVAKTKGLGLIA